MQYLIYFLITAIGIWVGYNLAAKHKRKKSVYDKKRAELKENNKKKIMTLFREKREISNNDIEKLLDISDAMATKYLDELEREEKIRQEGRTGRGVVYKKTATH